jgi:hypothetical protein
LYARTLARSIWKSLFSHLVGALVEPKLRAASMRRIFLLLLGVITWVVLAYILHPYVPNSDPVFSILLYPFRALFAADVFKHVLIAVFVFWLAYRAAAIYLDDIFELKNIRIAERFIRQSAFASQYDVVEIKDGEVNLPDQNSPLFLIGGPGKVRVYLENAAVFEQVGGMPRVIGPTTQKHSTTTKSDRAVGKSFLARSQGLLASVMRYESEDNRSKNDSAKLLGSFERIRSVIDLRDQVQEISVHARTRDGIPVTVKNMRVIYSVLRDGKQPSLQIPYPYNQDAVESLVYDLTRESWTDAIAAQIKREIGAFIFRHTLSEFLAAIGRPELEQAVRNITEIQNEADRLAGLQDDFEIDVPDPPPFIPRPGISDLFYDYSNFVARVRKKGVELRWIGIGTWDFPSDIIPERHLQAWRITYENLARGNEAVLGTLSSSSWTEQMLALIHDTPLDKYNQIDPRDEALRKINFVRLVNAYRAKLHLALEAFDRRDESDTLAARKVRDVWTHLAHVVSHYAGDM